MEPPSGLSELDIQKAQKTVRNSLIYVSSRLLIVFNSYKKSKPNGKTRAFRFSRSRVEELLASLCVLFYIMTVEESSSAATVR